MTAQPMVNLTIDGRPVQVPAGKTILDAAKALGIEIPTLCHNDALHPYGSCWVCAVKVEGARTLVPSCSTEVREGMVVHDNDPEVRNTRKLCLELLLSDHSGDCFGPCHQTCPAGIDVQGYLAHVRNGQYDDAIRLIKEKNPLPLICGRVCPRPCEEKCRRNLVDEPVAVDAVKRFVADWDLARGQWKPPVASATGKKVAVIGGGPAGLTAAYFLAQRGHAVTIFEAQPKLGGMLRWGIPAYRLPREVLDAEIDNILSLGIAVKPGKRLGKDFTVQSLHDTDGFNAVFVGIGATESRLMGVPGEDLPGVMPATGFLLRFGLGEEFGFKGKRVAVIGGGNSAIDAARTSLRLGAKEVTIIYRRSRAEMPAQDIEVEDAEHEGVTFRFLAAPTRLTGAGKLEQLEFARMDLGEPDASGRRKPILVKGSEQTIPVDICIAAIGQVPDIAAITGSTGLAKSKHGAIEADPMSLRAGAEWLFAGGDCVNGAATVVESVAHGREAAVSIDRFLNGQSVTRVEPIFSFTQGSLEDLDPADFDHFLRAKRHTLSCLEISERLASFAEVEEGLSEQDAQEEAKRCLSCGCDAVHDCRVRKYAGDYGAEPARFAGDRRTEPVDLRHPLIRLEAQKCIMCGACVRVCDEVRGVKALSFSARGFNARVRPVFGDSLLETDCISCGACVDICPTGAIVEKMDRGIFAVSSAQSRCTGCGVGCATVNQAANGRVVATIAADPVTAPNHGQLCLRGRFGHRALEKAERITRPMIRKNGTLQPVALADAMKRVRELSSAEQGALPIYCSPHASVGEMQAAAALAREAKQGQLLGLSAQEGPALAGIARVLATGGSPLGVADIATADLCLLVEYNPDTAHPVAGVEIRRAQPRMKLVTIGAACGAFTKSAVQHVRPRTESTPILLAALADLLGGTARSVERETEVAPAELADLVELIKAAKRPVIVIDCVTAGTELAAAAARLAAALRTADGTFPLIALRQAASSTAFATLGFKETDRAVAAKTSIAIREDVCAIDPKAGGTWIVFDCVMGETARKAEVVIPLPAPHELTGHVMPTGAVPAELSAACTPMAGSEAGQGLHAMIERAPRDLPAPVFEAKASPAPAKAETLRERRPSADTFTRTFRAWATEQGVL